MDIGIGRLPVSTREEAAEMIEKIRRYTSPEAMGQWRNTVCMAADDEDNNLHMADAEALSGLIGTIEPRLILKRYTSIPTLRRPQKDQTRGHIGDRREQERRSKVQSPRTIKNGNEPGWQYGGSKVEDINHMHSCMMFFSLPAQNHVNSAGTMMLK
ncbi:MAG: C25 family cysteine peptidase [Bacteroidales bacterium]